MKKIGLLLAAVLIILVGSSFQQVVAQEKTRAEMEKEKLIQEEELKGTKRSGI